MKGRAGERGKRANSHQIVKAMERYLQIITIAMEAVIINKFRSILTALGIIFGVAAVIAMLAIGEGSKRESIEQIRLNGDTHIGQRQRRPKHREGILQGSPHF